MLQKGIYRHFKGGMYKVVEIAKHSETLEDLVIYQSLSTKQFWARPLSSFLQMTTHEGKQVERFAYVGQEGLERQ